MRREAPAGGGRPPIVLGGPESISAGAQPLIEVDAAASSELVVSGRGPGADILRILTAVGAPAVRLLVLIALVGWLAWRSRWHLLVLAVTGGVLVGPLVQLLKVIFDRPRPSYDGTAEVYGPSYPSGHAAGSASLATILVLVFWPILTRSWRAVLLALAVTAVVTVGYTRVALGVHFTPDVVAGWCVGTGWVLLIAVLLGVWPGQPYALRPG